jgi:hypothetical protein
MVAFADSIRAAVGSSLEVSAIKRRLQDHFSDGLVTIVGSGLSCAEGLPGMGELAQHLIDNVSTNLGAHDAAVWAGIIPDIVANGLEAALLTTAPSEAVEVAIVRYTADLISSREQSILSEVFNRTRELAFTRLVKHINVPNQGLPIVTTNYDRLLETAVEEAGLGCDTMFLGQYAGVMNERESRLSFCRDVTIHGKNIRYKHLPKANIYKPHGSLDWYHRDGKPVRYSGILDLPRLIITPGTNKFRNGYENPFDRHREKANSAIDKASRLLVVGYGFNDDHLETHLTPQIKAGVPTLILTHSMSANALEIAETCRNVIAASHITEDGKSKTKIVIDGQSLILSDSSLWNIHSFVDEVLTA